MEVHELHDILKPDIMEIKSDVKDIRKKTENQEYRIKDLERSKQNIVKVIWTVATVSIAQIFVYFRSKL
jgi:hypothetical protein